MSKTRRDCRTTRSKSRGSAGLRRWMSRNLLPGVPACRLGGYRCLRAEVAALLPGRVLPSPHCWPDGTYNLAATSSATQFATVIPSARRREGPGGPVEGGEGAVPRCDTVLRPQTGSACRGVALPSTRQFPPFSACLSSGLRFGIGVRYSMARSQHLQKSISKSNQVVCVACSRAEESATAAKELSESTANSGTASRKGLGLPLYSLPLASPHRPTQPHQLRQLCVKHGRHCKVSRLMRHCRWWSVSHTDNNHATSSCYGVQHFLLHDTDAGPLTLRSRRLLRSSPALCVFCA